MVLRLANLNQDPRTKYPELGASYKAAATKTVCIFLAHRCSQLPPSSHHLKLVVVCAWAYHEYLFVLDRGGRFLTDAQRRRADEVFGLFLACYSTLASLHAAAGRRRYKLRPKFHYADHAWRSVASLGDRAGGRNWEKGRASGRLGVGAKGGTAEG